MKTLIIKWFAPVVVIFTAIKKADTTAERWLRGRLSWWNNWCNVLFVAAACALATGLLIRKYQYAMAMPTPPSGVTESTFWTYETKWKYSSFGMDAIHVCRGTTEFQVFKKKGKGKDSPYMNYLGTTYEEFLENTGLKGKLL